MSQMNVQIVTPDGLVYDHHAAFVSVKTIDGELGILPHHINTIAVLAVDQVKVRRVDDDKHIDWIAVNGGIIEVADNVITIVADSAERARDIDISRAERAKLRAEKAIEEAKDQHSVDMERRAKIALQRAINRINVGIWYNSCMIQMIFNLSSHLLFIFFAYYLLMNLVQWEKFLKVSAENAVKIRFLILMISVGIGYLASSFFISVYEMSRQIFIGQF